MKRVQARIEREQAELQALLEAEQEARNGSDLRENLEFITNNNNFDQLNMDMLSSIARMILVDNQLPINRLTILQSYIMNLESMTYILRNRNVHSDLKHLCEKLFEEMYEKLAKEKQIIDFGYSSHNESDTTYLTRHLNGLNSI